MTKKMKTQAINLRACRAIALAALTLGACPAFAQSSVTMFGVVDAGVSRITSTGVGSRTGISSGNDAASRLGFRGTEDLGGGLSASFWLESAVNLDNGNSAGVFFQRRSTVSLSSRYGEIRLGRDYAPTFWNVSIADPYLGRGIGATLAKDNFGFGATRNSNSVGYILPSNLGGIYGQLQYSFGEKLSTTPNNKQANYAGGRLGYARGPLNLAGAYGVYKQVIGPMDTSTPPVIGKDLQLTNFLGSWDFGFARMALMYGVEKVRNGPAGNNHLDSLYGSIVVPVGPHEIRLAAGHYDRKDSSNDFNQYVLGYNYSLSKRTRLYATVARVSNKGASAVALSDEGLATTGVAPGGRSTGFDLGIRHTF